MNPALIECVARAIQRARGAPETHYGAGWEHFRPEATAVLEVLKKATVPDEITHEMIVAGARITGAYVSELADARDVAMEVYWAMRAAYCLPSGDSAPQHPRTEGRAAYRPGGDPDALNPHPSGTPEWTAWRNGWFDGHEQQGRVR